MKTFKILKFSLLAGILISSFTMPSSLATDQYSKALTEDERKLLEHERTTSFVIINDEYDFLSRDQVPHLQAAGIQLQNALQDDQIVLCTKTSWAYLQKYTSDYWLRILAPHISEKIYALLNSTNVSDEPKKELYKKWLNLLKKYEDSLYSAQTKEQADELRIDFRSDLAMGDLPDLDENIFNDITYIFTAINQQKDNGTNTYRNIVSKNYICKEVDDDYVLFVPKKMQYQDQRELVRDGLIGLSYTKLSVYDYRAAASEVELAQLASRAQSLLQSYDLTGKILHDALRTIHIDNQNIAKELLPFFDMYVMGHGEAHTVAEIPIYSIKNVDGSLSGESYFQKIMKSFENFRPKTVGLSTCFIGGKKTTDAYNVYNKFNSALLENLSYAIINIGTLYQTTFTQQSYNEYFSLLNETPPNYMKVAELARYGAVDNYVSVKLPHTSWFTPVQLEKNSLTLSQVAMSTRKTAVNLEFGKDKVIILGANYIPQALKLDGKAVASLNEIPVFLPSNYYNQNYYFKSLEITNLDVKVEVDLFSLLSHVLFKNLRVTEPMIFGFEKIQIGATEYKNVYCLIHNFTGSEFKSGFSYTDFSGTRREYTWPSDKDVPGDRQDPSVEQKTVVDTFSESFFKQFESSIMQTLSPALRLEFLNDLSSKLEDKRKSLSDEAAKQALDAKEENERSKALDTAADQIMDDSVKLTKKEVSHVHRKIRKFVIDPAKLESVKHPKRLADIHKTIENQINTERERALQGIANENLRNRLQILKQRIEEKQRSQENVEHEEHVAPDHAIV